MKNKLVAFALLLFLFVSMVSCYTLNYTVGKGPQKGITVVQKNHYLIAGLAPIKTSNPHQMAGDAQDYEVTITHTFVDGLINVLTRGLYKPTTTIIKK